MLRHAPKHAQGEVRALGAQAVKLGNATDNAFFGVLAHGARIEENNIRSFSLLRNRKTGVVEYARNESGQRRSFDSHRLHIYAAVMLATARAGAGCVGRRVVEDGEFAALLVLENRSSRA